MKIVERIDEQIVAICREFARRDWGLLNGNISSRFGDDGFLMTPSGVSKAEVTPNMIVQIDKQGVPVFGGRASTEFKLHLRAYAERPDIGAVVHAHPPYATAFAVAGKALDASALVEMSLTIGDVPVAPFAAQGTEGVGDSVAPFLAEHDVILLANHGAVAVGRDVKSAFAKLDTLELCAKTLFLAARLSESH
jgi:L-fuculose-phosphate aldolase